MSLMDWKGLPDTSTPLNPNNLENDGAYLKEIIDGIVESGSNANGHYLKFADGTLIQYGKVFINSGSTSKASGGITFYSNDSVSVTFPISFTGTTDDIYCYTNVWGFSYFYYAHMCATSTTKADIRYGSTLSNSERAVQWIAIGRWK